MIYEGSGIICSVCESESLRELPTGITDNFKYTCSDCCQKQTPKDNWLIAKKERKKKMEKENGI